MVYGILQCSNTDGDFFLVTRLLRIVERVQDIGSSLFCHLLPASLPCAQTRVHCSALHCIEGNQVTLHVFPLGQTTHSHSGPSVKS